MTMAPPGTPLSPGVFKKNDCEYYGSGVLVNHLADPDRQQRSVLTHARHAILSNLFLMCLK